MLKFLFNRIGQLYDKKINAKGLAVFRIVFSLVLLGEVLQLFYFRHLIFDKVPYLVPSEIAIWPAFVFWIIAILILVFGLFTKVTAIVNYMLTVIIIGTISSYEYHMFYMYLIISFLFIFLPISRTISIDRLLLKLKYSTTRFQYHPPETVSVLAYYGILLLSVGFVYFDSVFFKLSSPLWLNGLGLWLPSSLPQTMLFNISPILNLKYLALSLGYLTLIFEAIFLFIFWRKKFRIPVMIIGLGLHIGIFICYPLPFFALGVSAIYLLMVPVACWRKVFQRNSKAVPYLKFYYDEECPLCIRTKITLHHFDTANHIKFLGVQSHALNEPAFKDVNLEDLLKDIHAVDRQAIIYRGLDAYIHAFRAIWYLVPLSLVLRIPGIYQLAKKLYKFIALNRTNERCTADNCGFNAPELPNEDGKIRILTNFTLKDLKIAGICTGLCILLVFQVLITYNSPLLKGARLHLGVSEFPLFKVVEKTSAAVEPYTKAFLGITHHGVFMDAHFNGYNHLIAAVYKGPSGKQQWLPIFDSNGTPGDYLVGPLWVNWTFRGNAPLVNQKQLGLSLRNYTAFWAHQNAVNLKDARFEIRVKKIVAPHQWEYNFLEEQLARPWLDGGEVRWKNDVFYDKLKVIEKL